MGWGVGVFVVVFLLGFFKFCWDSKLHHSTLQLDKCWCQHKGGGDLHNEGNGLRRGYCRRGEGSLPFLEGLAC